MKEIELKDIKQFSKIYNGNINNKNIEKQIRQYGLDKICINQEIIDENPPSFNLELEETPRYDQKDSLRCWAFSGINVIKRNIAHNLNMDIMKFELSDNFIAFFHRLEKANTTYEKILRSKTNNLDKIVKKNILKNPVEEVGNWQTFVGIVKKYGLVPMSVMPITIEGESATRVTNLFSETIRSNAITLLKLKKQNKNIEELRKIKLKMLADNYEFLSKVYGEPVNIFNYDYIDKNGNSVSLKNITPNQFVEQFLSIDIELHHWMTITGVQIEEGIPKRWKVEDSYGNKEKVNGYYIMNDNYFDKYVFTVIIDKKYLSTKQLELYNQKGIIEES